MSKDNAQELFLGILAKENPEADPNDLMATSIIAADGLRIALTNKRAEEILNASGFETED